MTMNLNFSLMDTSAKTNVSLFTDDELETTDTANSSEQEYKYDLIAVHNYLISLSQYYKY